MTEDRTSVDVDTTGSTIRTSRRSPAARRALVVAGGYGLVATLWILFSDMLLGLVVRDPDRLVVASQAKGLLFVLVTTAVLLFLVQRMLRASDVALARLQERQAEVERVDRLYGDLREVNQAIVESLPGIFYMYDEAGRFLRWNRNFERVSGFDATELATAHPLDFFQGSDRDRVAAAIERVFADGEATVEAAFVGRDGSAWDHLFSGRRIEFDGRPCLLGVGVDISERTAAEAALVASEERYRSTVDAMLEACQLIDFEWRYLYLNPAAAIQNRRPNEELLHRRMPDAWPGIEASPVFELIARGMAARLAVRDEIEFRFDDGTSGWFDVRVQPVREGVFVQSIDITERRAAERALRELNATLEHKIAERTAELHVARERAEAADRLKSAFLATMSHELRTPLNSIIGFTGIVLGGMAGPLNEEQAKQLGMVRSSARHLLDLINDVLDISKIEAGQLEVRPTEFDLLESIERVVASVQPIADRKGISLRADVPPSLAPMVSDRRRVEQILINLLNNGLKFTDQGHVALTLDVVEDAGASSARIAIADTGIGIRDEDLVQLFQPFRQIDSGLQRQHEGTGLGLAISRRLTELLGGTISAHSAVGEGSVFTIVLPMHLDDHR
jgi:PAS domain S-box-containing protein